MRTDPEQNSNAAASSISSGGAILPRRERTEEVVKEQQSKFQSQITNEIRSKLKHEMGESD